MVFRKKLFAIVLGAAVLLSSCLGISIGKDAVETEAGTGGGQDTPVMELIQLPVGYGFQYGSFEFYFTDPMDPNAGQKNGGLDEVLASAIDDARLSVDLAMYSISFREVRNALIRARQRGVEVRMVMESDNMDRSVPQDLIEAGIPILGDRREGLMHDKFMLIDGSEVWLGSMNFTVYGTYFDNNQLIRIRSVKMAELYTTEFKEMYIYDRFGPESMVDPREQRFSLDGTPVEVYFSPDDGVEARIVEIISGAEESIYFMAFSFTSDDIGAAMVERDQAGITVSGVFDASQVASNKGTEFDTLAQAEIEVRLDGIEGQMHHKTIIVDEETVITGSYNFTASAEEKNDENLVIIHDPKIAKIYLEEYQRVFRQSSQP